MSTKTCELKVLVDPELRAQVNQARGMVPLSAWVREAIEWKLKFIKLGIEKSSRLAPEKEVDKCLSGSIPVVQLPTLYPPDGIAHYLLPPEKKE